MKSFGGGLVEEFKGSGLYTVKVFTGHKPCPSLNTCFQFLNNITRISTHFFTHTYFQKIQIILLEQCYQTVPWFL